MEAKMPTTLDPYAVWNFKAIPQAGDVADNHQYVGGGLTDPRNYRPVNTAASTPVPKQPQGDPDRPYTLYLVAASGPNWEGPLPSLTGHVFLGGRRMAQGRR